MQAVVATLSLSLAPTVRVAAPFGASRVRPASMIASLEAPSTAPKSFDDLDTREQHWQNFIYRTEPRHWHSHWTRYRPTGEILSHFLAEVIIAPLELEDGCTRSPNPNPNPTLTLTPP